MSVEFKPADSEEVSIIQDEREGWTSASNAQADLLCPGRHLASRGIESTGGADAEFGKAIHAALANGSDEGLTPEQEKVYDMIRDIEKRKLEEFFGPDAPRVKTFREERSWLAFEHYKHSGRLDVTHRHGLRGLVIEYKTLAGDVPDSPLNLQLRDQAVMAASDYILTEAGVCVAQPMVTMNPEIAVYDADALDRSLIELKDRVRKSNDPNSPRIAGPVQCKYCMARDTCAVYAAWAATLMPTVSMLDVPVLKWSPEQMALFLDRKSTAEKWIEQATDHIKELLKQNPEAVPGWTLNAGRETSTVNDPQALYDRLHLLSPNQEDLLQRYMNCLSVKKKEMEPLVRSLTQLKGKALDAKLTELYSGLLDVKRSEPSIVRAK